MHGCLAEARASAGRFRLGDRLKPQFSAMLATQKSSFRRNIGRVAVDRDNRGKQRMGLHERWTSWN
jgi:hypothetical protein